MKEKVWYKIVWFDLDKNDQEMIDAMIEKEELDEENEDKDTSEDKKKDVT